MSADQYITGSALFAAVLVYVYTWDSLIRIRRGNDGNANEFEFSVPSEDAAIFQEEFDRGELNISDARTLLQHFIRLTSELARLKRTGQESWVSSSWISGRRPDGQKVR